MARYKSNYSDFQVLQTYNKNVLGIPSVDTRGVQLVPTWSNMNYQSPNYESLNIARSFQAYAPINVSYASNDVNYIPRDCNKRTRPNVTQAPGMMTPTPSPF